MTYDKYLEAYQISKFDAIEKSEFTPYPEIDKTDDLITELFAPNPLTGFPSSSLSLLLNPNTLPEVQQFIKDHFCHVHEPISGAPDDDTALDTIKPIDSQYGSELDSYLSGLRTFVEKSNQDFESEVNNESDS